jgi:hypothetical protein
MYSPISDDDRPSGRRHSVRSRNGSMGAGSVRNGVKGAVPRRRSSAATTHNSVLKVKRKRSPAKEKDAKPPLNAFDRLATYMVERQISKYDNCTLPLTLNVQTFTKTIFNTNFTNVLYSQSSHS